MKNKVNCTLLIALLPLMMMAQSSITQPGATEPTQLYTTTYDNPSGNSGPNQAPGPNRVIPTPGEIDPDMENSPIGAPWALLAFAAAYGTTRLVRRRK